MKSFIKLSFATLAVLVAGAPFAFASNSPAPGHATQVAKCKICCGKNNCNITINAKADVLPPNIEIALVDSGPCGCIRPCWWRGRIAV